MKKMIFALLATSIIALAEPSLVNAQSRDKDIAFIPAKNHKAYVSFITNRYNSEDAVKDTFAVNAAGTAISKASLKATKANGKALKNFNNTYKSGTPEANWFFEKDAITATFEKDDVKTNVVYNSRGGWLHTLTYYPEDKTPEDVIHMIDYSYPHDKILLTVQVEEGSMVFYIVQLEDKTTFKKVTVCNGEVNLIEQFTKSN